VAEQQGRKAGRGSAVWVLAALVAGLVLGAWIGASSPAWREPLVTAASLVGGLWLDALKMTVIPLIVALLVVGIVGGADAARAGGLATKAVLWFLGL
jgi:Na+/H+-dicarboxylate symporter